MDADMKMMIATAVLVVVFGVLLPLYVRRSSRPEQKEGGSTPGAEK